MNEKIQQQLLDKSSHFVDQAAKTLGSTTGHVYEIVVRQQVANGIGIILVTLITLIATVIISWIFAKWSWARKEKDRYSEIYLLIVPVTFVCALVFFAVGYQLVNGIQHIINPEYYAIEFIFNTATGKGN